jgi:hypothetical protein
MTWALKNWWRKIDNRAPAFVEKDDALYWTNDPNHNAHGVLMWVGGYLVVFSVMAWYRHPSLAEARWVVALIVLFALAAALWHLIERRRYPLGRPLVQIDQSTLRLEVPGNWPRTRVPLSALRGVTFPTTPSGALSILLTFDDGRVKAIGRPLHHPEIEATMCDFLRRKLPPSIRFTIDNEAPYFGHGGL